MLELELNRALRGITPRSELRARVIAAAAAAAVLRSSEVNAFDKGLSAMDMSGLDCLCCGEYNPDYHKNMITRFTLCDPDDSEHLQGLVFSASR